MADILVYVKCKVKLTLSDQINKAIEKTGGKYAQRLNFQVDGFNARIPEDKLWIFLLNLMKDGVVVEETRTLAKKKTVTAVQ